MQALHDIFAIWQGHAGLATALNEKQDTVYRWVKRARIPDSAWERVIEAAKQRGKTLTVADLHAANTPRRPRGPDKPRTHKIRPSRKRRSEARAVL